MLDFVEYQNAAAVEQTIAFNPNYIVAVQANGAHKSGEPVTQIYTAGGTAFLVIGAYEDIMADLTAEPEPPAAVPGNDSGENLPQSVREPSTVVGTPSGPVEAQP